MEGRTEEMRKTGGLDRKMERERRDGRRSWKTQNCLVTIAGMTRGAGASDEDECLGR